MSQKGPHTWDLHLRYHRCPECGYIIESREGYRYSQGDYKKELDCSRCGCHFVESKGVQSTLGPFIGDPQPIETEWGDPRW